MNLIGSGVVFHVPSFFKELDELEAKGLQGVHDRIFVSDRVQINLDLHAAVDGLEEVELGGKLAQPSASSPPSVSGTPEGKVALTLHLYSSQDRDDWQRYRAVLQHQSCQKRHSTR